MSAIASCTSWENWSKVHVKMIRDSSLNLTRCTLFISSGSSNELGLTLIIVTVVRQEYLLIHETMLFSLNDS